MFDQIADLNKIVHTGHGTVFRIEDGLQIFDLQKGRHGCLGLRSGAEPYPWTEKPPSTGMAVPVTKSDAGAARKTAIPA